MYCIINSKHNFVSIRLHSTVNAYVRGNSMPITKTNQSEYWFHVSDQDEIPIAGVVDRTFDVDSLIKFLSGIPTDEQAFDYYLQQALLQNINLVDILRSIVGVSDKRMYLELSYIFGRTPLGNQRYIGVSGDSVFNLNSHALQFFKNLVFSAKKEVADASLRLFVAYFKKKKLMQSAQALSKLQRPEVVQIIESLILTKEVQQKEAKRRGHGAEFALACVINAVGCQMLPESRHVHAMAGRDANVDMTTFEVAKKQRGKTWSTDLIVLDGLGTARAFVQALIHTSDPGQYGVNKSDETVRIKLALINHNQVTGNAKELWGLVDGVGFAENKSDTIDKMIAEFDCFVQMKTLYKAGLRLHVLGLANIKAICFDDSFYTVDEADAMWRKYGSAKITRLDQIGQAQPDLVAIPAGKATLFI